MNHPGHGLLLSGAPALALVVMLGGCGARQAPKADLHPIDEGRAVLVMQEALEANGVKPAPGPDVDLGDGQKLHVELLVGDTGYGIAYVTAYEAETLGKRLPQRRSSEEMRIQVLGDLRVLLLYDDGYQYDSGETHSQTAVAAEGKLKRDIADYVLRVVKQRQAP
jgi:hypothetical protein